MTAAERNPHPHPRRVDARATRRDSPPSSSTRAPRATIGTGRTPISTRSAQCSTRASRAIVPPEATLRVSGRQCGRPGSVDARRSQRSGDPSYSPALTRRDCDWGLELYSRTGPRTSRPCATSSRDDSDSQEGGHASHPHRRGRAEALYEPALRDRGNRTRARTSPNPSPFCLPPRARRQLLLRALCGTP
jgi:hypothetical protein